jgi:hypothetical protein
MGRKNIQPIFLRYYRVLSAGLAVAVPAVDWPISAGLKRDFRLLPALGAGDRIHLAKRLVAASSITLISPV